MGAACRGEGGTQPVRGCLDSDGEMGQNSLEAGSIGTCFLLTTERVGGILVVTADIYLGR